MKNLKVIIAMIASLILALSGLQANNDRTLAGNRLSKKVQSALKTPAVLIEKNKSVQVKVYFSVDAKGNVNDVYVASENKEVKKDLEQQFLRLNINGLAPCVMNSVVINFVTY